MKRALVISGGGSKGAFAVGVIRYLAVHYPAITFDIIVGTSTGALIAPLTAAGEINLLVQLYTTVQTNDIISKGNVVNRLLSFNSLYDVSPVAKLITQYYTDRLCNNLLQSSKQIYLVTTCLQTSATVNFSNRLPSFSTAETVNIIANAEEMRRAVLASACQPVFMPPIEIRKGSIPLRQYVDGGLTEWAGLQLAIDAGADEVYTILLTPAKKPPEEKTFNDAFSILEKTVDIFTDDVGANDTGQPLAYNQALTYIALVKSRMLTAGVSQQAIDTYFNIPGSPFSARKPLDLYIIRPDAPLGGGPGGLTFNPAEMKTMLARGEARIAEFMAGGKKSF